MPSIIEAGAATASSLVNDTVTGALSGAFSTMQSDIVTIICLALPAGLAICGLCFAIRKGFRFFMGLAS